MYMGHIIDKKCGNKICGHQIRPQCVLLNRKIVYPADFEIQTSNVSFGRKHLKIVVG